MEKLVTDKETDILRSIASAFPRSPLQVNQFMESDSEILKMNGADFQYIVLKVDGLYEEISEKLYEDPFLIGWMAVTVTISDLAATGSQPVGLLLSLQLPRHFTGEWMMKFQQGINEACSTYNVSILGGDTNFCEALSVSTTGIATIKNSKPLLRKAMKAGDSLYATGKLGLGNAFAYTSYFDKRIQINYQPVARLKESKLISNFATACMDTSDGLFPALSVLSEINNVGFDLIQLDQILHRDAMKVVHAAAIPSWMLLAGPHGEYELIFTISPDNKKEFEQVAVLDNMHAIYLGKVTNGNVVQFTSEAMKVICQPSVISNLFSEANGNIHLYFELLKKQHSAWNIL